MRPSRDWTLWPSVSVVVRLGDPDPKRSQRVMQAMLKMKKIEIDNLERAAAQA